MTTSFKLCYSGYIRTDKQYKVLDVGVAKWTRGGTSREGYYVPRITGEAKELLTKVHFEKFISEIIDGDNWVFVLRQDQAETAIKNLHTMAKLFDFSVEQVHKSPNFSNLNYCTGNYLNLYIFKVKKNG